MEMLDTVFNIGYRSAFFYLYFRNKHIVPIICKTECPIDPKFAIVGGVSLVVGITSIVLGAYKKGAGDFHDAELQALRKVGAVNWDDYQEFLYYHKERNKKDHAKSNFLIFNKKIFKK